MSFTGPDKVELIAYRIYVADHQLNGSGPVMDWDSLSGDDRFEYIWLAQAAIRSIALLEDFQKDKVAEAYRERPFRSIKKGETLESYITDHFEYGWNTAFFAFDAPVVDDMFLNT